MCRLRNLGRFAKTMLPTMAGARTLLRSAARRTADVDDDVNVDDQDAALRRLGMLMKRGDLE